MFAVATQLAGPPWRRGRFAAHRARPADMA